MFTILGCGSIGSLVAWACAKSNLNYQLILRHNPAKQLTQSIKIEPLNLAKNKQPIFKQQVFKQQELKAPVYQFDKPLQTLIVPVKAYQVESSIKQLTPYLTDNCTIILLHNGLGTVQLVKQYCPSANIILATTTHAAFQPQQYSTIQTGLGESFFGPVQSNLKTPELLPTSAVKALITAFKPACWDDNIQVRLWEKLAINSVINPLTALANVKNGALTQAEYQAKIKRLVNEFCEVSELEGFKFEPQKILSLILTVATNTANNYSSMNQDIYHNRLTEIDYINGYLLKVAAKHQLILPHHQVLFDQIKQVETN